MNAPTALNAPGANAAATLAASNLYYRDFDAARDAARRMRELIAAIMSSVGQTEL